MPGLAFACSGELPERRCARNWHAGCVVVPVVQGTTWAHSRGIRERRRPVTSIFMTASALEVVLFLLGSVIFVGMVVAAAAVITWAVAGFMRATHP